MNHADWKPLRLAYRSLLLALSAIAEAGYEVTMDGLCEVVQGQENGETSPLLTNPAFGYLPSLSSKRLKARLRVLLHQGTIALNYAVEDRDYYLALTAKGKEEIAGESLRAKPKAIRPRKRNIRASKGEK